MCTVRVKAKTADDQVDNVLLLVYKGELYQHKQLSISGHTGLLHMLCSCIA